MTTLLPHDANDNPIPALALKESGAHQIAIGTSSTRNSTAFDTDTQIISLYCDVPAYIAFGDSSIIASASDHYFPAGIYYDIAINGEYTHMAALQVSDSGTFYISEKE